MKKLLIILLLIPSFAFAKVKNKSLDLNARVIERCKNWDTLEDMPQKEAIRCLKALIIRNDEAIRFHNADIINLYDVIDNFN